MSLMRQTFQSAFAPMARVLLAVALVCALLVTQFGLTRHVVEHATGQIVTASVMNDNVSQPDSSSNSGSCLTCLEHQAHGAGLISATLSFIAQPIKTFELQALAPNTPYLAPERASQRAPPVLS